MWNKRSQEDNYNGKPQPQSQLHQPAWTPPAEPVKREPAPPPRVAEPPRATIGPSMTIKGEIRSKEQLFVDGEVEGTLTVDSCVTIGPNGKIKANIKAKEVVIQGSVKGNVEVTEKIAIRKNGSLVGDIHTAGIVIDDGAYFKGSIDIVKPEPARQPAPAPVVAQPAAAGR